MKYLLLILLFACHLGSCQKNDHRKMNMTVNTATTDNAPANNSDTSIKTFTWLALGDSYTIGHNVFSNKNYPNQSILFLQQDNIEGKVKIIATTGWTTTDLKNAIAKTESSGELLPQYDIVTLLIGVNNQYQGKPVSVYKIEFEELLLKAIALAGNNASHVIVLSIPDWGVTPFAGNRDREKISKEIDEYNAINKDFAGKYHAGYLDITPWTREAANDFSQLAGDGLHPSGKEYSRWAASLERMIKIILLN